MARDRLDIARTGLPGEVDNSSRRQETAAREQEKAGRQSAEHQVAHVLTLDRSGLCRTRNSELAVRKLPRLRLPMPWRAEFGASAASR